MARSGPVIPSRLGRLALNRPGALAEGNVMDGWNTRGIHVSPGSGIVARLGTFVAYATGDDDGVNHLIVRLNALTGAPWSEVVRTLTSDIAQAGFDEHPQLACASIEDGEVGILVFGDLQLTVATADEVRLFDGRDSSTWIDLKVYGSAERIHCGQQAESDVVGVLRDGVVPGGGFLFDRVGPIPAAKRWADDVEEIESATEPTAQTVVTGVSPEPRADDAAEIEMQGFDDEPETPEPVAGAGEATVDDSESPERQAEIEVDPATVSGVLCPEGHLTNPNAPICHRCGASVGSDAEATTGPRPSLGTLTFDDGATLELDRPVVLGADVPSGYTIDGEPAIIVELDNEDGSVSPVHVEVRLRNWEVEVIDAQSTCGTYVRGRRELQSRTRLRPAQATVLTSGSEVKLGSRSFVYTVGPPPPADDDGTATEIAWLRTQR